MKLAKAGWWLFAMGSLGLDVEVLAQSSPYSPKTITGPVPAPVSPYAMPAQAPRSAPASPYAAPTKAPAAAPAVSPYQQQSTGGGNADGFSRLSLRRTVLLSSPSASQTMATQETSSRTAPVTRPVVDKGPATVAPAATNAVPAALVSKPVAPEAKPLVAAPVAPVPAPTPPVPAPAPAAVIVPAPLRPIAQAAVEKTPVLEEPTPVIVRLMEARERQHPKARLAGPDDYARMIQTRVMLAWLADPVTCRYPLKARASGAVVEVSGTVPNQHIRAHALNVAERISKLDVTDAVRIHPGIAPPVPVKPPEQLRQDVQAALAQGPERHIRDLKVQAHPTGLVSVQGTVPSLEHQLAVSQCVRSVAGCTGVDNQLAVRSFHYEGKAYTLVSADGRYIVAGVAPASAARVESVEIVPLRPASTDVANADPVKWSSTAARTPPLEPEMPTMVSALSDALKKRREKKEFPAELSASQPAMAATVSVPSEKPAITTASAITPAPAAPTPKPVPEPAKPVRVQPTVVKSEIGSAKPAGKPESFEKVRVQSPPATSLAQRPSDSSPSAAAAGSSIAVKGTPGQTQNLTGAPPASGSLLWQEKPAMPPRKSVSSGVVVLASANEAQAGPEAATATLQGWLKDQVANVCGKDGRDLHLLLRSTNHMTVDLKARDAATAHQLSRKILGMQELEPYRVTLKIQVAQ